MGNGVSIVEDILNGKDLLVVLENRYGRHYKESYNLDTIILKGDVFWGKFSNVHSPIGHKLIKISTPLSYAYNNFSDVVCTMNYAEKMQRYVGVMMYSRIQFKTKGNYRLAVNGANEEKNINYEVLNEAVENALNIKLIICDNNELIHVLPVHTIELYEDKKDIGIDTNFECVPTLLYNFDYFIKLEDRLKEAVKDQPVGVSPGTDYMFNSQFSILSYVVIGNDIFKRVLNSEGIIEDALISYKWFKIYCEV